MFTKVDDALRTGDVTAPRSWLITRSTLCAVLVVWLSIGVGIFSAPVAGAAISANRAKVQFIEDEVEQYNAVGAFAINILKLSSSATRAQVRAVSRPLGLSIGTFQRAIHKQPWPKNFASAIKTLSSASSTTRTALLDYVTTTKEIRTGAVNDINVWIADVNTMNHDLGLPPFKNLRYVDECQADGAIVVTAMAAFHAETHGLVVPTISLLTGKKHGGPYLRNWPHNRPHYTYSINRSGDLYLAAPSSAKPIRYRRPSACDPSFE
jgi:hypothetical protein